MPPADFQLSRTLSACTRRAVLIRFIVRSFRKGREHAKQPCSQMASNTRHVSCGLGGYMVGSVLTPLYCLVAEYSG